MHYHIYKHGESKGNDPTVDKAYWLDISSKHHCIYLNGCDHIPVKEDSEYCTCQDPYKGQQDIFPEYILGNLAIIKSQDLQCCKLSLTLCDIDVVQILQYHKCQHSRRNDQDPDHRSKGAQHSLYLTCCAACIADT